MENKVIILLTWKMSAVFQASRDTFDKFILPRRYLRCNDVYSGEAQSPTTNERQQIFTRIPMGKFGYARISRFTEQDNHHSFYVLVIGSIVPFQSNCLINAFSTGPLRASFYFVSTFFDFFRISLSYQVFFFFSLYLRVSKTVCQEIKT